MRLYPYLCEAEAGGFLDLWEFWSQPGQPTEVLSHLTKWNKLELGMGTRRHASSASSRPYLHIWVVFLSCSTEPCDRKHSSHCLGHFIFQLQAQGRFQLTIWISNQICQGRDLWASLDQVSSLYKPTLDMNELSFKWVGNCEGFCQVSICVTVCMHAHRGIITICFLNWSSLLKLRAHTGMDGVSHVSIGLVTFLAGLIRHVDNMKLLSRYTRFLIF